MVEGRIYAIGGRLELNFANNLDANEEYDPVSDTWRSRSPLPTARSGLAAAALDGRIHVVGGEGTAGTFEENEVYDPATDSWTAAAPLPTPRHGLGAAALAGVIYVLAGGPTPGGSQSGANEAFRP